MSQNMNAETNQKKYLKISPDSFVISDNHYEFCTLTINDHVEIYNYSVDERMYDFFEFAPPSDLHNVRQLVEKWLSRVENGNSAYWSIRDTKSRAVIGTAAIINIDSERSSGEWGFGLDPNIWGHGHILKIQESLLKYSFEVLKLNRLFGKTFINNERTKNAVLASGMLYEGTLREFYLKDGTFHDAWIYGMTYSDYLKRASLFESNFKILTDEELLLIIQDSLQNKLVGFHSTMENTRSWDSLRHMSLIMELQQKLNTVFNPIEISTMISVTDIISVIKEKWR